jgi:hypothetical protein
MISIGGLQGIGDVLADPRFTALDLNDPTDGQVASAAAARGSQGIGTRDTGGQPVADFGLLGLNLLANVAVNLCDLDAALASVPEPQRTQVAAALAFMDDGIKKAIRFGTTVEQTINEPQTKAIIDTIAGLTIAVATDPTLSCLVGQGGQNPFGADLRTIDSFLLSGLPQVTQRFSLLQLSLKAVDTLLCAGVGMAQSLLPTAQGNDLKRLIGCLPPLELVAPTLAFSAGGLDLQIALQCSNDNLLRLQRMVEVALSEVNEVIAFFNQLKNQNFVTHALQARNDACSSDVSVVQVTAGASGALGVGL